MGSGDRVVCVPSSPLALLPQAPAVHFSHCRFFVLFPCLHLSIVYTVIIGRGQRVGMAATAGASGAAADSGAAGQASTLESPTDHTPNNGGSYVHDRTS
jgi:hypothetical protein